MADKPSVERRVHPRSTVSASVQFHHEPSQRDFPARCVDLSRGGLLMRVPATAPVQVGHALRLSLGAVHQPELAFLASQPLDATIVRVDRRKLLRDGHVAVGVRFAGS